MRINDLLNVVAEIMNQPVAQAICLSTGGWEGWLQCQLWYALTQRIHPVQADREVQYPNAQQRCDLVVALNPNKPGQPAYDIGQNVEVWIEIKALGGNQVNNLDNFINGIRNDVLKLNNRNVPGLSIVVVPKLFRDELEGAFNHNNWQGFIRRDIQNSSAYYLGFGNLNTVQ
jgi:hypothetical protein